MRKDIENKVFLKNDFFRPEHKYYLTCPDEGQSSDEFLAEYGFVPEFWSKSDYHLCAVSKISDIDDVLAKSYVDLGGGLL